MSPGRLKERGGNLDEELQRRARYVVTENERVLEAARALRRGRADALGEPMVASYVSLRDDFEVSCPELDLAVGSAMRAGAVGARMTGGGFGGSAIVFAPDARVDEVTEEVVDAFAAEGFKQPEISKVSAARGGHRAA